MINRVAAVLVALLVASGLASAQEVRGFVVGGSIREVDGGVLPTVGGGATVDLGTPWLSAGAQAETFFSWPYFGGRASVFGQGNFPQKGAVRGLVLGGGGFGEDGGPLIGGGVELHPGGGRLGVRLTVEDYLARRRPYVCGPTGAGCAFGSDRLAHQIAVRGGITF